MDFGELSVGPDVGVPEHIHRMHADAGLERTPAPTLMQDSR
jgi:hypothetical protein